jgi:predicted transcriptional regulator
MYSTHGIGGQYISAVVTVRSKRGDMASEKNVALPDDLLTAVAELAETEGKTPDEIIAVATRRYIAREQLDRLVRRNEQRALELGIKEEDVPDIVKQWRREQRRR